MVPPSIVTLVLVSATVPPPIALAPIRLLATVVPFGGPSVRLLEITDSHTFHDQASQITAALRMRSQLETSKTDWLCDSRTGVSKIDRAESKAWNSWAGARLSPKTILGEGLMAAAAWQAVAAIDAAGPERGTLVSVVGCNQQAIGARFGV